MAKIVCSLVLSQEIVAEVDRQAVRLGRSRSAMVNHILGEYTRLSTPEGRAREIAQCAAEAAEKQGLRSQVTGSGTLSVRTALRYKYSPALHYTIEPQGQGALLGELRLTLRSGNESLLLYLESFFALYQKLEQAHLPQPPGNALHHAEPKRFTRLLRRDETLADERQAGEALAAYIGVMNQCLDTFFDNLEDAAKALAATERCYLEAIESRQEAKIL